MQPVLNPPSPIRRALAISAVVHLVIVSVAWWQADEHRARRANVVDIEMAPAPPPVEALPEEVAKPPTEDLAHREPDDTDEAAAVPPIPDEPDEGLAVDAGIDAPPDAGIDAPPDAGIDAPPDAPLDAPDAQLDATMVAGADAGVDAGDAGADATQVAMIDAGVDAPGDATPDAELASVDPWGGEGTGTGSGEGDGTAGTGSGSGSGGMATEAGSGSGSAGMTNDPAVAGAPTTAGTAANLLAYFPAGHMLTALIRFDRLRGTEWAKQTERLLRPMPDYRLLFGPREAKIYDQLDTLVISTPEPRDATATTLVGHTHLARGALRRFLGKLTPIAWSTVKGGLLGKRTGHVFRGDRRLFLSPFHGWFLLAQPKDLAGLTAPSAGNIDSIQATGRLPAWLSRIRKIESESGDDRGPALVVTIGLPGNSVSTGPLAGPLGIKSVQLPERISLAMELVKQGWLVRGNIRFKTVRQAAVFLTQLQTVQRGILGASIVYERILGKAAVRVIQNFRFARTGQRVSYTTSISIADTRAILSVAAQQIDTYYRRPLPVTP